jgi:predicted transglutaminase-like cysteine proteinase
MAVITGTYSKEAIVKNYLVASLYDAATLSADITEQAANAKVEINNVIGRATDFTPTELAEVKNEPVVLSASQYTAYLMQRKPQELSTNITEDTILDGGEALNRLKLWMINNGITPPEQRKIKRVNSEVNIQWTHEDYAIYGEAQ